MSRTASDVLSGAAAAPAAGAPGAAGAGGAPPPGAPAVPAGGAPPAGSGSAQDRANAFWNGWDKPEQKEVRDFVANKNYADPYELAKSYRELERTRGHNVVPIPRDEYDPQGNLVKPDDVGRAAWNKAMGVPESPDGYQLPVPENNPYPEFTAEVQKMFHANGVPPRMASALVKGYESAIQAAEASLRAREDAASEAGVLDLEREWGPKFQENSTLAARGWELATKQFGITPESQRALETAIGTTAYLKMMHALGSANAEGRFAGEAGHGTRFQGGASEAQSRLDQITADRAAGKINDHQWRNMQGEVDALRDRIVGGMPN